LAEAVLVDDPVLAVPVAEAAPVPVALAEAALVAPPFVELLAEAEAVLVPLTCPPVEAELEDELDEEPANAKVETPTIAKARKTGFMGCFAG
jgi:hypothetical protein